MSHSPTELSPSGIRTLRLFCPNLVSYCPIGLSCPNLICPTMFWPRLLPCIRYCPTRCSCPSLRVSCPQKNWDNWTESSLDLNWLFWQRFVIQCFSRTRCSCPCLRLSCPSETWNKLMGLSLGLICPCFKNFRPFSPGLNPPEGSPGDELPAEVPGDQEGAGEFMGLILVLGCSGLSC